MDTQRLRGRVSIVTGAAAGIGEGIASALALEVAEHSINVNALSQGISAFDLIAKRTLEAAVAPI